MLKFFVCFVISCVSWRIAPGTDSADGPTADGALQRAQEREQRSGAVRIERGKAIAGGAGLAVVPEDCLVDAGRARVVQQPPSRSQAPERSGAYLARRRLSL